MKKILVPVDFSELSENATNYAVELAKRTKAELILINVFYVPVFAYDAAMMLPTAHELERESIQNLEKLKKSILKMNDHLKVRYYYTQGIPVDEINIYAIQEEIDLIVIGAQGTGYLEERIFGSTATTLIRSGVASILVINKHVKFREPEKIVLAVDYAETDNNSVLKTLKQLIATFDSHLFVLNVFSESYVPPSDEVEESFHLAHALKYVPHTFSIAEHNEVVTGIKEFVKQQGIHMVAMIARSHSLLSRIFHEPYTKEMAFHSEVPLLVLHEQKT